MFCPSYLCSGLSAWGDHRDPPSLYSASLLIAWSQPPPQGRLPHSLANLQTGLRLITSGQCDWLSRLIKVMEKKLKMHINLQMCHVFSDFIVGAQKGEERSFQSARTLTSEGLLAQPAGEWGSDADQHWSRQPVATRGWLQIQAFSKSNKATWESTAYVALTAKSIEYFIICWLCAAHSLYCQNLT